MKNPGEAFTFVFKDPDWPAKILIGGAFTLLSIFLVGLPVVYGYCIELQERVRRGEERPLPEWKDVGVKFITGFKYFVTVIVYSLPLIFICLVFCGIAVAVAVSANRGPEDILGGMALTVVILLLFLPIALLLALLNPFISLAFGKRERIVEGLDIGRVLRDFGRHWPEGVLAVLISAAASVGAVAGLVLFIVGILFTSFYALLVRYHLFGQIGQLVDAARAPEAP